MILIIFVILHLETENMEVLLELTSSWDEKHRGGQQAAWVGWARWQRVAHSGGGVERDMIRVVWEEEPCSHRPASREGLLLQPPCKHKVSTTEQRTLWPKSSRPFQNKIPGLLWGKSSTPLPPRVPSGYANMQLYLPLKRYERCRWNALIFMWARKIFF